AALWATDSYLVSDVFKNRQRKLPGGGVLLSDGNTRQLTLPVLEIGIEIGDRVLWQMRFARLPSATARTRTTRSCSTRSPTTRSTAVGCGFVTSCKTSRP